MGMGRGIGEERVAFRIEGGRGKRVATRRGEKMGRFRVIYIWEKFLSAKGRKLFLHQTVILTIQF